MPEKLEYCVKEILADPDFVPEEGHDREDAAYAICTARMKLDQVEQEGMPHSDYVESTQTIKRVLQFEAKALDDTGSDWRIRIINAGTSRNNREYPLDVLHRDALIFEGVPVHAGNGRDHSPEERGVKSIVGFIKNVDRVPEGLDGTFHVSDPTLRDTLLDLHKEGVLSSVVGFSIVAEGRWQSDQVMRSERAIQLVRADSVDLVREPAAGGKFLAVAESEEVIHKEKVINTVPFKEGKTMEITEEKLKELLAEASEKGVETYKESTDEGEIVEEKGEDISKVEEALTQLNSTLLNTAISGAGLPDIAEKRIRVQFEGGAFDASAVQKAIADEKDYLATLTKVAVENVTTGKTEIIADEGDKKLARLDASFTPSRVIVTKDGERVKGYRTFTEAYCDWTGKNPFEVGRDEVWEAWMNGSRGYASWREEAVNRLYSEAIGTSEWAEVAADRMHKALLQNYAELPQYQDWKKVAKVISVNDYQAYRDIKIGGFADLAVVAEAGTYANLTNPTDEETSVTMQKRGGIAYQITRELVLNDNIGAVAEIPRELARSAARTLYKQVFNIMGDNDHTYQPDSVATFNAAHNNIGTTALSIAGLNETSIGMRSQTRYGATADVLGAANAPRTLVVPNELTSLAMRIANPSAHVQVELTADADTDIDAARFAGLDVITVDYFTNATQYFTVADPDEAAGIVVAFLNGNEEPDLFIQNDETQGDTFTNDVQSIKVRHEFNTTVADFRPLYRQIG